MTFTSAPDDFAIDPGILQRARTPSPKLPDPIVSMEPTRTASEDYVGILREIRPLTDPLQYYGLPRTAVGRASLREIGRQPVRRVTIHVPYGSQIESYTCWVPAKFVSPEVRRGVTVAVHLDGVQLLDGRIAWFCTSLEVLSEAHE